MRWDPTQYQRYAEPRWRPFAELLERIDVASVSLVVDLGCGPGPMTRQVADRWPDAQVIGVDSSSDMIEAAAGHAVAGRVSFQQSDVATFEPPGEVDVVVANALLQWVPDQLHVIRRIAGWLSPGGAMAFQVPANFEAPSHRLLQQVATSPRWRSRLADVDAAAVHPPEVYLAALQSAGLAADVWQTTYFHVLHGDDPVLEWLKGTALRPLLDRLQGDASATDDLLDELASLLRQAYPPSAAGPDATTVLPFTRTFAVGHATMDE